MWTLRKAALSFATLQATMILIAGTAIMGFLGLVAGSAFIVGGSCVSLGSLAYWLFCLDRHAKNSSQALSRHLYSQGAKWLTTLSTFFIAMSSASAESSRPILLGYIVALLTNILILPLATSSKSLSVHCHDL